MDDTRDDAEITIRELAGPGFESGNVIRWVNGPPSVPVVRVIFDPLTMRVAAANAAGWVTLDAYVRQVIREELHALTAPPPVAPKPRWANGEPIEERDPAPGPSLWFRGDGAFSLTYAPPLAYGMTVAAMFAQLRTWLDEREAKFQARDAGQDTAAH